MRLAKVVKLKCISQGCPEQWEGELSDGRSVYVRERHGEVRIEIDGEVTHREAGHDALAVLESYLDCSELERTHGL